MATRFVLVVRPDGQALLTTKERLSAELLATVGGVMDDWSEGKTPIVLLAECDVVQVRELSIELKPVGVGG